MTSENMTKEEVAREELARSYMTRRDREVYKKDWREHLHSASNPLGKQHIQHPISYIQRYIKLSTVPLHSCFELPP
jgi:hypothetical protein